MDLNDEFLAEVAAMSDEEKAREIARLRTKLGALESLAVYASHGHVCGTPGCPLCVLRVTLERGARG